jgi:protein SCO1/2
MKSRKIKSILIGSLFSALVPLAAFLFLKMKGHDGHIAMPAFYGIDRVDSQQTDQGWKKDTTFHRIQDIRLQNQLGDTISIHEDLKGKILVFHFFFTSCHTICPVSSKNMKLLNKAFFKNDTSIRFISISVDPVTDSVPRLRAYAEKYEANHDKWMFMTGDRDKIYAFARQELHLDLPEPQAGADDFIHPDQIVLVDKYHHIRGYYNALDSNKVRFCAEDIAKLMVEKHRLYERKRKF